MQDVRTLPVQENDEVAVTLDELAREGARRMIAMAPEAEVDDYLARFVEDVDEDGRRLVVRNGRAKERGVTVGSGTMRLRAPRVNDKRVDEQTGKRQKFSSRRLQAGSARNGLQTARRRAGALATVQRPRADRRRFNGAVFKDGERVANEDNDIDEKVAV